MDTETLSIEVLKEGGGKTPQMGHRVLMHYELWAGEGDTSSLYDYDKEEYVDNIHYSTYDTSVPLAAPIEICIGTRTPKDEVYTKGQSIEGLDRALLGMKEGEKVALTIPADLAYGEEGGSSFHTFHGYRTPPHMPIRCNIELVEILKKDGVNG
tara:strand:- start:511 stop:972 length:462 start_codon:yes stop_codon:yes gene_type:complete